MRRLAAAALLLVATGVLLGAAKEHVAERFDVVGTVLPDGSLEVVEEIAFRFTGGEYTAVTRELRATESDGVRVIDAAMDGQLMPQGTGAGQVEIDPSSRGVKVEWHFAPTVDRVHVFRLRYRYAGVVRHGDDEDWFRWPPFPSKFDYPIVAGSVRLTWPEGASLRRPVSFEGPAAASWPIPHGIGFEITNYRQRDDDLRLTVRFRSGAFLGQEPQWERNVRRAERMAPAFIAGGVMILAAATLALFLFFLRYRRERIEGPASGRTMPPGDLPAAAGGAIAGGRMSVGWWQMLASMFELARRGVLTIEEQQGGGWVQSRKFTLRRGHGEAASPHERAVLDALFKSGATEERFDRALQRLGRASNKVKKALHGELTGMGYLDAERQEGASALTIAGIVIMVLGLAGIVVLAIMEMRFGPAALAVPGALIMAGFVMLLTGVSFSTLSQAGMRAAREWRAYQVHLKRDVKAGRIPADGDAIGRLLPYAAALGVLAQFGKALQKTDVRNVPAWLRTLDAAGSKAAMIAIITSGSHHISHGTGAAGSGGGGVGAGGSSSAR